MVLWNYMQGILTKSYPPHAQHKHGWNPLDWVLTIFY